MVHCQKQTAFLLCSSALCYGFAFIFSSTLWWLIILYPLFLLLIPQRIGFFEAFFWSFIAHSIHLIGIAVALYRMNTPLFIIIGMFFYTPLVTGFIFIVIKKIAQYLSESNFNISPIVTNGIALFLNRLCITYAILFPFGRIEGYIFMDPLILFINSPFRAAIQAYNLTMLTILFYGTITTIILWMQERRTSYIALFCISLLLVITPHIMQRNKEQEPPSWIHHIAAIALFFPNPKNLTAIRNTIDQKIKFVLQKKPDVQLFVLPEGAINCPLSSEQINDLFSKDINYSMIICSSSFKKQKLKNACFFVHNKSCDALYYKRHALPVTEQSILNQDIKTTIWPSKNKHPVFSINEDFSFVPYICSDFFFNNNPDDTHDHVPIITLCNDIWFGGQIPYIQQLMLKTAQFKALNWNRQIVYIAYSSSYYINTDGQLYTLMQIQ